MNCPIGAAQVPATSPSSGRPERADAHSSSVQVELHCVWTGDPASDCSCASSIPEGVVTAAWRQELEQDDVLADRFFHITWQDDVWLAYGLVDGGIRGVHCPAHRAERQQRAAASARIDEHVEALALYA
jgi:hypothetical protein